MIHLQHTTTWTKENGSRIAYYAKTSVWEPKTLGESRKGKGKGRRPCASAQKQVCPCSKVQRSNLSIAKLGPGGAKGLIEAPNLRCTAKCYQVRGPIPPWSMARVSSAPLLCLRDQPAANVPCATASVVEPSVSLSAACQKQHRPSQRASRTTHAPTLPSSSAASCCYSYLTWQDRATRPSTSRTQSAICRRRGLLCCLVLRHLCTLALFTINIASNRCTWRHNAVAFCTTVEIGLSANRLCSTRYTI